MQSLEHYSSQLNKEVKSVEHRGAEEVGRYRAIQVEFEEKLAQQQKEIEWKNQTIAELKYGLSNARFIISMILSLNPLNID